MQDLDNAGLADPAEEILIHVQPSFVQLGDTPVAEVPTSASDD